MAVKSELCKDILMHTVPHLKKTCHNIKLTWTYTFPGAFNWVYMPGSQNLYSLLCGDTGIPSHTNFNTHNRYTCAENYSFLLIRI
jgi:predicted lipase